MCESRHEYFLTGRIPKNILVSEGNKVLKVGFIIPKELHQRLKEHLLLVKKGEVTQSEFVSRAITVALDKEEKKTKT